MAVPKMNNKTNNVIVALLLLFAGIELSSCQFLKGNISCLDCTFDFDLSGYKVVVKCEKVKKLEMATTEADGSFEMKLPSQHRDADDQTPSSTPTPNCLAKLLGGPNQLYVSKKNMATKIIDTPKIGNSNYSFTISAPLSFSTSNPKTITTANDDDEFGSSKTVDFPLPPEWGFAPSSYYIPFIPIIGIP